jgi:hypothetical protein
MMLTVGSASGAYKIVAVVASNASGIFGATASW